MSLVRTNRANTLQEKRPKRKSFLFRMTPTVEIALMKMREATAPMDAPVEDLMALNDVLSAAVLMAEKHMEMNDEHEWLLWFTCLANEAK